MTAEATIARLLVDPRFRDAVAVLEREHDRTVADIITLTEIPAPPFGEEKRAAAYLEMLRAHGLEEVEQDADGCAGAAGGDEALRPRHRRRYAQPRGQLRL